MSCIERNLYIFNLLRLCFIRVCIYSQILFTDPTSEMFITLQYHARSLFTINVIIYFKHITNHTYITNQAYILVTK